jgi:hypothetical protein
MKLLIIILLAVYANDITSTLTGFNAVKSLATSSPGVTGILSTLVILLILRKVLRKKK